MCCDLLSTLPPLRYPEAWELQIQHPLSLAASSQTWGYNSSLSCRSVLPSCRPNIEESIVLLGRVLGGGGGERFDNT
jgi:hypothetical protein